jgi:hypothetical protein
MFVDRHALQNYDIEMETNDNAIVIRGATRRILPFCHDLEAVLGDPGSFGRG